MKIKELIAFLEKTAPPQYQEAYDNAGLIVGDVNAEVTGVVVCGCLTLHFGRVVGSIRMKLGGTGEELRL